MIFHVIDYRQLYKLSRLIDLGEFKGIDFTAETFFHYLIDRFDADKIKVFVNVENKEINGFVICSLSQDVVTERPEVFIDLAWIKKGTNGKVGEELLEKAEDYTRELNLSRISGFTLRGQEKAMFRKYGFRPYSTIMVKDLKQLSNGLQNSDKGAKARLQEDNNVPKVVTTSHKQECKEYYAQNKGKILQKRKEHYKLKKMKNLQKKEAKDNAIKKEEDRT